MVLVDRFGRPLTHMRISVTLRCNHRCVFCHMEGISGGRSRELSASDWGFLARVGVGLGIKYYKVTGGEPLLRSDIVEIVRGIAGAGGEVSIVTNGSLLSRYAEQLAEAGVSRINVSLHSLKPEVFREITGGRLESVVEGVMAAVGAGIPVKLDYLVLSLNRSEYREIIGFAEKHGLDINVIELIPLGMGAAVYKRLHTGLSEIEGFLEEYSVRKMVREFQSRPVYILPSGIRVTLVKGYNNPEMCMRCTRLRVTPDGRLKTCIYRNDNLIDAGHAIASRDEDELRRLIELANSLREPFFKRGTRSRR